MFIFLDTYNMHRLVSYLASDWDRVIHICINELGPRPFREWLAATALHQACAWNTQKYVVGNVYQKLL